MKTSPLITLITDFGLEDVYVGVMKGVILGINPNCRIIDITHSISPHDIYGAMFAIQSSYKYFPSGTIHLIVVDPGVGTNRRVIVVKTEKYYFVCPDNGLISMIINEEGPHKIYEVTNKEIFLKKISYTFQGRDIFAPVASYLSVGMHPEKMGREINDPVIIKLPKPSVKDDKIYGEVIHIDRFGNLITNIPETLFKPEKALKITIGKYLVDRFVRTYQEAPPDKLVALIGSTNTVEISKKEKNTAQELNLKKGEKVTIELG